MKNELAIAQLAVEDMVLIAKSYAFAPGMENTDSITPRKSIAARAVKSSVELAASITGAARILQVTPV